MVTVNPSVSVAKIPLASLSVSPSTVAGGGTATGTATLERAARPGGVVVQLATSNFAVATVPSTITVPENATSATFPITTSATTSNAQVVISGLADNTGWSQTAGLVVTPGGPSGPTLSTVGVSPTSVVGGATSTGTVTLSGAPRRWRDVSLSDNSSAATVPASVTVPRRHERHVHCFDECRDELDDRLDHGHVCRSESQRIAHHHGGEHHAGGAVAVSPANTATGCRSR